MEKTFYLDDETHTTSALLRMELLKDENVMFAAYKVPHPLFKKAEIRVKMATGDADSAMDKAKYNLRQTLKTFKTGINDI